jgi:hypothetical protein
MYYYYVVGYSPSDVTSGALQSKGQLPLSLLVSRTWWPLIQNKIIVCPVKKFPVFYSNVVYNRAQKNGRFLYSEPDESNPHPSNCLQISFNTILSSTPNSSKFSLSIRMYSQIEPSCNYHIRTLEVFPWNLVLTRENKVHVPGGLSFNNGLDASQSHSELSKKHSLRCRKSKSRHPVISKSKFPVWADLSSWTQSYTKVQPVFLSSIRL